MFEAEIVSDTVATALVNRPSCARNVKLSKPV